MLDSLEEHSSKIGLEGPARLALLIWVRVRSISRLMGVRFLLLLPLVMHNAAQTSKNQEQVKVESHEAQTTSGLPAATKT